MKAIMVAAVLAACGGSDNKPDATAVIDEHLPPDANAKVERGRYIVNVVGACTFCHTPLNADGSRDLTRLFAGVDCLVDLPTCFGQANCTTPPDKNDGFGCISSRNLTNDATGLKNVSDDMIKDAFKNGHRTDGKSLAPVMPYYVFYNSTDDDADAIVAYLRTVPGVDHTVKANEQPWASMNDAPTPVATHVDMSTVPMPAASWPDQAAAMRGRYLTSSIGACIDCHTKDAMTSVPLDTSKFFAGGRVFAKGDLGLVDASYPATITTRNLTPDATGLMGWSAQQVKDAIAKGKDRDGKAVCAATHGSVTSTYAGLEAGDLDDIVQFLQSIPATANDTSPDCQGPMVQ